MSKVSGRTSVDRSDKRRRDELARRIKSPGVKEAIRGLEVAANKAYADGELNFDRPVSSQATRRPSQALGMVYRATCREAGVHVEIHPSANGHPVVHWSLMRGPKHGTSCVRLPAQDLLRKGLSDWITVECVPDAPIGQLIEEFEATIRRLRKGWRDLNLPLQEQRGRPKSPGKQARNLAMYLLRIDGSLPAAIAARFGIKERTVRDGIGEARKAFALPDIASTDANKLSAPLLKCRQCFGNSTKTCQECPVRAEMRKLGPSLQGLDGGELIEEAISTIFAHVDRVRG